ncbi:MAG: hypothetical protein RIS09_966 [Actinomycetota bacterium]
MTREPLRNRSEWDSNTARELNLPPLPDRLPLDVVDSHCHLDIEDGDQFLAPERALLEATSVGVNRIVQVGVDVPSSRWSRDLAHSLPRILAAVAIHPNEAPRIAMEGSLEVLQEQIREIEELASDERVRAIGETGLDFFRTDEAGRSSQMFSFEEHIRIAKEHNKALMIHDRDAHEEVVQTLLRVGAPEKVIFHCFSGDAWLARVAAEHGWYCSFAGTVTFKNAKNVREGLSVLPLQNILVETDAPFLTPEPFRGRPNASYLIPHTVRFMAEFKGIDIEKLCAAISENSENVFGSFD